MDEQIITGFREALRKKIRTAFIPAEGLEYACADHTGFNRYDRGDWRTVEADSVMPAGTVFLRGSIRIPGDLAADGEYRDYLCVSIPNREGQIMIDGEHYHGHDHNRTRIPLKAEWAGKTLPVEILSYGKDRGFIREIGVERIDKLVESYFYDFAVAAEAYQEEEKAADSENRHLLTRINKAIETSLQDLDPDAEGEVLHDSVRHAAKVLKAQLADIDDGDVRGLITLVGHTHIDDAWLWQLKDTVRKCGHTFLNMLRLMDEYPEFIFSCSQLQLMAYTKEHYPEVFEQIKKRVQEGRWEIVGPMWVESDCNITSGESMVRQILYGSRFSEAEFGLRSRIAWLPDTFSFQSNLPQIFKKSGTDYFYSYKLHWQRQNEFPYGVFRWQGIDGSEVISAVINNPRGAYNGNPTPFQLRSTKDASRQCGKFDDIIFPYGYGDGGGGPTREMIEYARRLQDFPGLPRTRMSRAEAYFDDLNRQADRLPVCFGELYIETHRGTMSSHGEVKRQNRVAEIAYQNAEKLGVYAEMLGAKPDWKLLAEGWKELLLLQFHDILPGSSIHSVYAEDCAEGYRKVFGILDEFMRRMTGELGKDALIVCNFLSWTRSAVCEAVCPKTVLEDGKTLVGPDGKAVPFTAEDTGDGNVKVIFEAKDVPAMGAKKYAFAEAEPIPEKKCAAVVEKDGGLVLETGLAVVEIDAQGRLARLYDKEADRETITAPANDIRLFRDGPQREDAWNLYEGYKERLMETGWEVSLSLSENSAFRTVVHVEKKAENCVISQDVVVHDDSLLVEFRTKIDWRRRHTIMRVYFPMNIRAQMAAYETGFGTFLRPTVASSSFDEAKFEVCGHKFADLSEGDYGVSVLNDCKYGHDCVNNTIGLTLLRGTTYPDPEADLGQHEINYAIWPHAGDWRAAQTARKGHEFNNPVRVQAVSAALADAVDGKSFVSCANPNVIVDTIKKAEDGDGYIVRLYESNGNRGRATLEFIRPLASAEAVNLVEQEGAPAEFCGNAVKFDFAPYEIKSFRVMF